MRTMGVSCVMMFVICSGGLSSAAVRVASSNGGESFPAGSTQVIVWQCDTSSSFAEVAFSYSDGVVLETAESAAPFAKGQGTWVWKVPAVSSPRCLIRVTAGGGGRSEDYR